MNIFKQFYRSIYSPKDIASFRTQGIWKTIAYLLILSIITSIPTIYYLNKGMNDGIHTLASTMEEDVPDFRIEDNSLHSDLKEPKVINKEDLTIIIDSTGTYNEKKISSSGNTVALLQKEFVIVTAGQAQSFEYSYFGNITATKSDLTDLAQYFDSIIPMLTGIMAVVFFIFLAASKAIEAFILAIFGTFFARILGKGLTYRETWKITVYSMTIPTLFFFIMDSLETNVPNGSLLNWFITLFIVFLSIKEIETKTPIKE
ncbi:DUF1189 domain-containing protein [Niallia circulans]|uniref:DUF1189 domain-containing protein n=1 Tax=Niallia circulans TaxID=1397 RepID=A0A553SKQ6_NIACI|nr:DUF1189 domain-containing protein [Niallia circulans]TRZ37573.1 DUF1189 domain-containing protein [Niallia circulans]